MLQFKDYRTFVVIIYNLHILCYITKFTNIYIMDLEILLKIIVLTIYGCIIIVLFYLLINTGKSIKRTDAPYLPLFDMYTKYLKQVDQYKSLKQIKSVIDL